MNEGMIEWGRDITYGTNVLPSQVLGVRGQGEDAERSSLALLDQFLTAFVLGYMLFARVRQQSENFREWMKNNPSRPSRWL